MQGSDVLSVEGDGEDCDGKGVVHVVGDRCVGVLSIGPNAVNDCCIVGRWYPTSTWPFPRLLALGVCLIDLSTECVQ